MEKRRIGSLEVSVVGLGCNNFGMRIDADATAQVVDAALNAGINFFDTADIYGGTRSEEYLGKALGSRRKDVVVATKFGMPLDKTRRGAAPQYVKQAVEASLQRLNTDYIDLYQLHQPDAKTPIADTLAALDELVRAGTVREIGCSNFSAAQLIAADQAVCDGAARFVSVQNQYSLLHREPEAEVLPTCSRLNIAFIPFFPLASGLLTGKYHSGDVPSGPRFGPGGFSASMFTEKNLAIVAALSKLSEKYQRDMLQLAISWLLTRDSVVSVIAGATTPSQIRANARAYTGRLPDASMAEIETVLLNDRY